MGPVTAFEVMMTQSSQTKKDLRKVFGDLLEEFKSEEVNGNITLHFAHGYLAKIHSTKVD